MDSKTRIIGGIYRNRTISVLKFSERHISDNHSVRPTQSKVRVVLFDILMNYLPEEFTFMDVCAGFGTVGIEALSREAKLVVFCDINKRCIQSIRDNIKDMHLLPGSAMYINKSALKIDTIGKPMDAIYIDPPYQSAKIITDIIDRLLRFNWINEDTILAVETSYETVIELKNFDLIRNRKIAKTMLHFFKLKSRNINEEIQESNVELM